MRLCTRTLIEMLAGQVHGVVWQTGRDVNWIGPVTTGRLVFEVHPKHV